MRRRKLRCMNELARDQGEIRSGPNRQVDIGVPGQLRRPRIDDDELRAPALRLADVRHEVNAGR